MQIGRAAGADDAAGGVHGDAREPVAGAEVHHPRAGGAEGRVGRAVGVEPGDERVAPLVQAGPGGARDQNAAVTLQGGVEDVAVGAARRAECGAAAVAEGGVEPPVRQVPDQGDPVPFVRVGRADRQHLAVGLGEHLLHEVVRADPEVGRDVAARTEGRVWRAVGQHACDEEVVPAGGLPDPAADEDSPVRLDRHGVQPVLPRKIEHDPPVAAEGRVQIARAEEGARLQPLRKTRNQRT
jgi:hypothetical protein